MLDFGFGIVGLICIGIGIALYLKRHEIKENFFINISILQYKQSLERSSERMTVGDNSLSRSKHTTLQSDSVTKKTEYGATTK